MLNIALLGQFDVRLNSEPINLTSRPVKLLLAFLLLNRGQSHRRERLAGLLWPDSLESTARKNLRNAVWRLRQSIGNDYLLTDKETIAFNATALFWSDVVTLEEGLKAGADEAGTEQLIEAVSAYKGQLMPGYYEEWLHFERERLQAVYERLAQLLLNQLSAARRWQEAINWAEHWIAQGSVPEPAYRSLMLAHAELGDLAGMAGAYNRCEIAIQTELAVEPSTETQALYEQLSQGGRPVRDDQSKRPAYPTPETTPSPPPQRLPIPPTPIIGRQAELDDIHQLMIETPANHLVTLVGPGGIGKTRLALEAATRDASSYPHGAFFVSLAPINSAEDIVPAIAESIDFRFYGEGQARQLLLEYLRRKQMLLVMDNFEHLIDGADFVAELLGTATGVKILATSRERLHLIGEAVYQLSGLSYPKQNQSQKSNDGSEITNFGSVQLLLHSAHLIKPELEPSTSDLGDIARICQLVQGMPLAIVLAAGWLEMLSFKEIANEIAQNLDFLEDQMQDLPERQRSVRAAFNHSWKQLAPGEQQVFMKLAVFRGGFSRRAAQMVTGADLRTLRTLLIKSLISGSQPDEYEIHELLRQYAEEELETSDIAGEIHDRHSDYYLAAVAEREAHLKGRRQLEALDEIESDFENVRSAWRWAFRLQNWEDIDRALESLFIFFETRSRFQEGAELFKETADSLIATADLLPVAKTRPLLGRILSRSGFLRSRYLINDKRIGEDIEVSVAIARQYEDESEIAFALLALGHFHSTVMVDYASSYEVFKQSLDLYRKLDEPYYLVTALHRVGYALSNNIYGNDIALERFIEYTSESLQLAREIGNRVDEALTLSNLSSAMLAYGNYESSADNLRQAIVLARELGDRATIAHATTLLSLVHFMNGDLNEAHVLASKGLSIASDIGFKNTAGYARAVLSMHASVMGENLQAREYGQMSKNAPSNKFGQYLADLALGVACTSLGDSELARNHMEQALEPAIRFGWLGILIWVMPVTAVLLAKEGQKLSAVEMMALVASHPYRPTGWPKQWAIYSGLEASLRQEIDSEEFQAAWERGQALDLLETAARLAPSE